MKSYTYDIQKYDFRNCLVRRFGYPLEMLYQGVEDSEREHTIKTEQYTKWHNEYYKDIDSKEIDNNISELKVTYSIILVNDASTEEKILETKNLINITSLKLINMRNNKGHARCIATGLKHILENEDFDYVIPMDGDGEDRPEEIRNFLEKIKDNPDKSIVGERVKRSEGLIFKFCYFLFKI